MSALNYPVAVNIVRMRHARNTLQAGERVREITNVKRKRSVVTTRLHNECFHLLSAPRAVFHIVRVETDVEVNVLELHDGAAGNVLKPWRKKGKSFIRSARSKKWLAPSLPAHLAK